jgi:DTW domain-containing protein YfiP
MNHASTKPARAECYRCHKPRSTCICGHVQRIANRTSVWLAQHPRERFHPIGTARIARLGLDKVHLEVLYENARLAPASLPPHAGLLYPGADAVDLATLRPEERPETLIVIDGTWPNARTLFRDNPWLGQRPRYHITPQRQSRYRLRREPAAECLSTIEAIVEALRVLEPETAGLDGLLCSFDAMIDHQIAMIEQHRCGPRQPLILKSKRGIPRCVLAEPERVVVVGFETARRCGQASDGLEIVHLAALRVATGEVFQQFVRPPAERFPSQRHLAQMGLRAEQLEHADTSTVLRRRWQRFASHEDIVVAWNQSLLDALGAAVGLAKRRVHLKSAYRSHAKHGGGSLAEVIARLQLPACPPPPLCGRAGDHVADVAALLQHLQA